MNFSIFNNKKYKNIQKSWNWQMWIPSLYFNFLGLSNKYTKENKDLWNEDLLLNCRTTNIPGKSIEKIETSFLDFKQQFDGSLNKDQEITVEFEEKDNLIVIEQIYEWFDAIRNTQGDLLNVTKDTYSLYKLYKKSVAENSYLYMINTDGKYSKYFYEFKNMRPTDIQSTQLSYENSEAIRYSVVFSFDDWLFKPRTIEGYFGK